MRWGWLVLELLAVAAGIAAGVAIFNAITS
jgi:hypothetical protein